jgi:exopolyphosphatase/guanosine-5'-triphosphate,3'-diphosphate pyrophosphatase
MPAPIVAIVDIGSNSIKLLVASKSENGDIQEVFECREETRIGDGISADRPALQKDSMQRALASVQLLLSYSEKYKATQTEIVATSAVRDATNRHDFSQIILENTSRTLRVLSGETEARLIGLGVRCDPEIRNIEDFYLFDLGGGSLECLSFQNFLPTQSISLPLGSVRLTEKWIKDTEQPSLDAEAHNIRKNIIESVRNSGFTMNLPSGAPTVITGGTVMNVRSLLSDEKNNQEGIIPVSKLEELLEILAPLTLTQRKRIPKLSPQRADIFPTALTTLVTLSSLGNFTSFRYSFYNLRYGLASEFFHQLEK